MAKSYPILGIGLSVTNVDLEYVRFVCLNTMADTRMADISVAAAPLVK